MSDEPKTKRGWKPCCPGDNRPTYTKHRVDKEVCLPCDFKSKIWSVGDGKLSGILASDFGLGYGKTCLWKTPWCKKTCYAYGGNFDMLNNRRRLTWVQNSISPADWYWSIKDLPEGSKIRFGRSGDCGDAEITMRICQALVERPDIIFMWPTRAWRGAGLPGAIGKPWAIIQHYLPGKLLCSYDTSMGKVVNGEWVGTTPKAPAGYVLSQKKGERPEDLPGVVDMCPHYIDRRPCGECLMCFTTSNPSVSGPRNVAFYLHGWCKGTKRPPKNWTLTAEEWRAAVARGEIVPQYQINPQFADGKKLKMYRPPLPPIPAEFSGLELNGLEITGNNWRPYNPRTSGYTAMSGPDIDADVCRDYDP